MSLFGGHEMMPEDKYVKVQRQLMMMPPDQMMTKIAELNKMCICPSCPTYNDCAKKVIEDLFCSHGTSFHCILEMEGACTRHIRSQHRWDSPISRSV